MNKYYGSESKFEFAIIKKDQEKKMENEKFTLAKVTRQAEDNQVYVVYRIEKKFNQLGFLKRISEEIMAVCSNEESLNSFLIGRFSSTDRVVKDLIRKEIYTHEENENHEYVWKIKIIKLT